MKVLGEGLIEKIFSSIGDESKRWADLYKRAVLKGDTSTEFQILRELANRKYGKPKEHVEQEVKLQMSTDEADRIIREHFGQLASLPVLDIKPVNVLERFEGEEQRQNGAKREFEQLSPPRIALRKSHRVLLSPHSNPIRAQISSSSMSCAGLAARVPLAHSRRVAARIVS